MQWNLANVVFVLTMCAQPLAADEFEFLPDGTRSYLRIDAASLFASPVYKQVLNQHAKQAAALAEIVRDGIGIKHEDIQSFVLGGSFRRKRGEGVAIFNLRLPASFDDIKRTKWRGKLKIESRMVGDYQMHLHTGGDAFAIPNPNCLLMGEDFSIQPILERGAQPRSIENLRKAVAALDHRKPLIGALSLTEIGDDERPVLMQELTYLTGLIDSIDYATLEVAAMDGIDVMARFYCRDDAAAETVQSEIPVRLQKLKATPGFPAALAPLFEKSKCEATGRVVQLTGRMSADDAIRLLPAP